MKKYEFPTGAFYLQELPITNRPLPNNSISSNELDFNNKNIVDVVEEDNYTIERYIENGVAKVMINFQKDEDGRGLILMMDEADMERNGFK
jgi:hypothetical protein